MPRGGGIFTTGTPHYIYSAYISALIGVLEEAQITNNKGKNELSKQSVLATRNACSVLPLLRVIF
jgi:hypothetical protein